MKNWIGIAGLFLASSAICGADPISITVNPAKPLARITEHSLGVAVAVWDQHMTDPVIPGMIKDAGFKVIRYPGGSYSDIYHWQTHTCTEGTHEVPVKGTDFDTFMGLCRNSKATPLITVNYGSNPAGTGPAEPGEAADWVRDANVTHSYGVKYWEIGNEVYGNGFYNGQGWEEDLHAPASKSSTGRLHNPALGPTAYGKHVVEFVQAMKAVDPTIKVGAVLTVFKNWPDGVEPSWNAGVLTECGKDVDFVVVHWYPGGKTVAEKLASHAQVPGDMDEMRKLLAKYCGGRDVKIWMTEGDSDMSMKYPGALFAAEHFMTWWSAGVDQVNWWNLHNGLHVNDNGTYDDQGMISSGQTQKGITQPPANTPFSPYFGTWMVSNVVKPGDTIVSATGSTDMVSVHAVHKRDGTYAFVMINRDPSQAATVDLKMFGFRPAVDIKGYRLTQDLAKPEPWSDTADKLHAFFLPAYSVTTMVVRPK